MSGYVCKAQLKIRSMCFCVCCVPIIFIFLEKYHVTAKLSSYIENNIPDSQIGLYCIKLFFLELYLFKVYL